MGSFLGVPIRKPLKATQCCEKTGLLSRHIRVCRNTCKDSAINSTGLIASSNSVVPANSTRRPLKICTPGNVHRACFPLKTQGSRSNQVTFSLSRSRLLSSTDNTPHFHQDIEVLSVPLGPGCNSEQDNRGMVSVF